MIRIGLLGQPVSHSRSPGMHAAALEAAGLDGEYTAIDVAPEALERVVRRCAEDGYAGLNVTIPHKEAVFALCDEVDELASLAGAVNTLTFEGGRILGSNTDVAGLIGSLEARGEVTVTGAVVLVIGAGGAARAAVVGLLRAGAERVEVCNRSLSRAGRLCATLSPDLPGGLRAGPMNPRRLEAVSPCAVINATSVGMSAAPATPEWDAAMRFVSRVPFEQWPTGLAFDLVYTPARTAFLAHAEAGGWRTLGGLDMLARQGALSFERWTGVAADDVLPAMRRALADAI